MLVRKLRNLYFPPKHKSLTEVENTPIEFRDAILAFPPSVTLDILDLFRCAFLHRAPSPSTDPKLPYNRLPTQKQRVFRKNLAKILCEDLGHWIELYLLEADRGWRPTATKEDEEDMKKNAGIPKEKGTALRIKRNVIELLASCEAWWDVIAKLPTIEQRNLRVNDEEYTLDQEIVSRQRR